MTLADILLCIDPTTVAEGRLKGARRGRRCRPDRHAAGGSSGAAARVDDRAVGQDPGVL
jgi:hypothetical protein